MILAGFSEICKSYPSGPVLKGVSGAVKNKDRIALLGSNGAGKTTLLEILAGKIDSDSGTLEIPSAVVKSYLPQSVNLAGDARLSDYVLGGLDKLLGIKRRINEIHSKLSEGPEKSLLDELGRLQTIFEHSGGYRIETGVREIITGLGFKMEEQDMPINKLSGGMRNRAALARLLISSPDLLLLDEPTNHLDISGLEYLESYLNSFEGGVIYVSHDRAFIRNTATSIWELSAGKIDHYPGGYDSYQAERQRRLTSLTKSYESQREYIEKTREFIRRNIAGQKTKQAKSRRKTLARLEKLERPGLSEKEAVIDFAEVNRSSRIVARCKNVSFSFGAKPLLENVNLTIERGDIVGLLGPNGSGKTTLVRLLLGFLKARSGQIELGNKLNTGYYDQHSESLRGELTPLDTLREVKPEWNDHQLRSFLARFLFSDDDVFRRNNSFSGGEQSRLALARLIAGTPNFLILDEPTNHLDMRSRESLEAALSDYSGTILLITHDRQFLDNVARRILAIEDGTITEYPGNYSEYKRHIADRLQNGQQREAIPKIKRSYRKMKGRKTNPLLISNVKSEIDRLEKEIADLETTLSEMENSSDWQTLSAMLIRRDELYGLLGPLYDRLEKLIESS